MLGHPSLPYHLEFTTQEGHDAGRTPTKDNLLVFYLPEKREWTDMVRRMEDVEKEKGGGEACKRVESWNPYWEVEGKGATFEDRDGWRIVLWNGEWRPVV